MGGGPRVAYRFCWYVLRSDTPNAPPMFIMNWTSEVEIPMSFLGTAFCTTIVAGAKVMPIPKPTGIRNRKRPGGDPLVNPVKDGVEAFTVVNNAVPSAMKTI